MKKLFFVLFFIGCCTPVFTQTTVSFKPGSAIGQDANIFTGPNMQDQNTNYGNEIHIYSLLWTWNSIPGTARTLLKFDELSTIPTSATIVSAELRLYGVPSAVFPQNSSYPGSAFGSNKSFIQRVTSPWNEQTVTWATQPTTTTVGQITIPQSTTQWNYNFFDSSPNLLAMVQDWVSNPSTNHGFMIRLETELRYRALMFASSDYSDQNLWPELIVKYIDCEADFSYTVNTANPNDYVFTASNPAIDHYWEIDGVHVSNAPSFTYTFSPGGSYKICYVRVLDESKCQKCITICVDKQAKSNETQDYQEKVMETKTEVKQGKLLIGDVVSEVDPIKIYPNPTTNEWNVNINTEKEETVKIQLSDINGKVVYSTDKMLTMGENAFVIGSDNLKPGHYILKITGDAIQFSDKLIKNQ